MGIYNRDNINYGSMLQNAIANRVAKEQREAQYLKDKGTLWGGTVKDVANTIGRGLAYGYGEMDSDEAELAELEERRKLIQQNQEAMQGYRPIIAEQPAPARTYTGGVYGNEDNPYKLPGNSNATQDEYFKYMMAMNKLFGGQ